MDGRQISIGFPFATKLTHVRSSFSKELHSILKLERTPINCFQLKRWELAFITQRLL